MIGGRKRSVVAPGRPPQHLARKAAARPLRAPRRRHRRHRRRAGGPRCQPVATQPSPWQPSRRRRDARRPPRPAGPPPSSIPIPAPRHPGLICVCVSPPPLPSGTPGATPHRRPAWCQEPLLGFNTNLPLCQTLASQTWLWGRSAGNWPGSSAVRPPPPSGAAGISKGTSRSFLDYGIGHSDVQGVPFPKILPGTFTNSRKKIIKKPLTDYFPIDTQKLAAFIPPQAFSSALNARSRHCQPLTNAAE